MISSRTEHLSTTVETEFRKADYSDLNAFIDSQIVPLPYEQARWLHTQFFMVLDGQSVRDRKVIVVDRGWERVDADGNVPDDPLFEREDLTRRIVWKIHRVPYEKALDFWLILSVKPGMEGDEFLEETIRPGA